MRAFSLHGNTYGEERIFSRSLQPVRRSINFAQVRRAVCQRQLSFLLLLLVLRLLLLLVLSGRAISTDGDS